MDKICSSDAIANVMDIAHTKSLLHNFFPRLPSVVQKQFVTSQARTNRHYNIMSNYLIKPLPDITQLKGLLPRYLKVWYTSPLHQRTETLLRNLFCERYSNTVFENVLIKTATLNELYAAGLGQPYNMAIHIMSLNDVDSRLQNGDSGLVDEIRQLGNTYTSFASKYCSFHNPDAYPIYDSFVVRVLREYNKSPNSFTSKTIRFTTTESPESYQDDFLPIVDDFREACGLQNLPFNLLDHLLWLMGKEHFVNYKLGKIGELYVIEQKGEHINTYEICVKLHKVASALGSPKRKEYVGIATDKDFKFVSQMLNEHCNYVSRTDGIIGEYYIDMSSNESIEKETISEKTAPKHIAHDDTISYDKICLYHKIYDSDSSSNNKDNDNNILSGLLDDIIKAANADGLNINENGNIVETCKDIVKKYREKKQREYKKSKNKNKNKDK